MDGQEPSTLSKLGAQSLTEVSSSHLNSEEAVTQHITHVCHMLWICVLLICVYHYIGLQSSSTGGRGGAGGGERRVSGF